MAGNRAHVVDRGLQAHCAVEVLVSLPKAGTRRRGSGYLVAPGRILTAAHVVDGASQVLVRFEADRPQERTIKATVRWQHSGIDVAVLVVPHTNTPTVSFGQVGEQDAVLRCSALGFPRFGRMLRLRGSGGDGGSDMGLYAHSRGYLFAHETLFAAAQAQLGPDIDTYWERLHTWAESYACKGWPPGTPAYLLQPYGRLLAQLHDTGRSTALATDVRRHIRMREVTGSDAACLAEIAAARASARRCAPDDLGTLAMLAAAEDLVARRNEALHPDIPAVYARLGHTRRAMGLARSVFLPMNRSRALQ
ncbi:serine protease [Streptomyces sp. MZ04]|uniref:S1 family peptidase n=1 Tax=Streptomyces sp. MZ04 TaxID=2559236 RepID=UPI0014334620|nr:serine protease [Streptomyces sp. MZ04]